jgi:hypothetical protein
MLDYNNRLLYVTGFGAIYYFLACIILILLPILIPKWFKMTEWESGPPVILNVLLLVVTATAFSFYIIYVGKVSVSLYILFKVILVCLLPVIILIILYKNKSLENIIVELKEQNNLYLSKISQHEKGEDEEEICIHSYNKTEKLILKYKNIVAVKSADNYIEIYFLEDGSARKKLIRNSLKNIELLLISQKGFLRCHRTSIVNALHISKLARSYSGYNLIMRNFEDKIPVSRQYLVHVKKTVADGN